MSGATRERLMEVLAEIIRRSPDDVTVTKLSQESGVARSVIYRDHRDVVDVVRRRVSPARLDEIEVLRIKVKKLNKLLRDQKKISADLAAVCANLLYNIRVEKERVERLEGRLGKIGKIK